MTFTSYGYLLFLLVTVLVVRATRGTLREHVLLVASLVFYAAWDVRYLPVLIALGVFTYWAGERVALRRGDLRALMLPIALILLVLSVFKYTGMLVEAASLFLPRGTLSVPAIILPLGISFYTFECISYLVDVYKGEQPLRPFRRFLLFPAFFPHMVAGPILRIREFAPQLDAPQPVKGAQVLSGIDRIAIGLFKKVVLADGIAPFVDQGFAEGAVANTALDNWAVTIGFALQIYFDFSSYTDIAIGSARLLGFNFPENFNLPYHAKSPSDFWNRWHMTLSRWIRDYLFFPLNLKAGRRIWLRYVYLVLVMAAVGLWHGPGLGFIAWGTLHGLLMVAQRVLEPKVKRWPERSARVLGFIGRLAALGLLVAAWVPFRAPTIAQAGRMLLSMFTLDGWKPSYSINDYLFVAFCVGLYFVVEPLARRLCDRAPSALSASTPAFWLRPLAYAFAIDMVFMFDKSNVAFIYFQF